METGGEGRGIRCLENREGRPKVHEEQTSREVLSNGELSSLLGRETALPPAGVSNLDMTRGQCRSETQDA